MLEERKRMDKKCLVGYVPYLHRTIITLTAFSARQYVRLRGPEVREEQDAALDVATQMIG